MVRPANQHALMGSNLTFTKPRRAGRRHWSRLGQCANGRHVAQRMNKHHFALKSRPSAWPAMRVQAQWSRRTKPLQHRSAHLRRRFHRRENREVKRPNHQRSIRAGAVELPTPTADFVHHGHAFRQEPTLPSVLLH